MKRCITILLALLILTACAAPASEPESGPSPVSEPVSQPSSSGPEPEPEPDPMPDLQPGRVLNMWDAQGLNPDYPSKTVKGTQAELDRWKAAVRDPAIARMDFIDLRHQTALLPVEQELEILAAMREAEIRLYEGNPDPSTGGGCGVTVYDGEENILFDIGYMGDYFSVWFAGDEVVYYFDGEGTTLDVLLTSDYGVPAEPISEDPDLGPQENPDTSGMYSAERMTAVERENKLYTALLDVFSDELSRESYSYYTCYLEDNSLVLEIGVIDEAAVDAYLAAWTGAKWDKLVKDPGRVSQARQEEFAERANKLDLGPDVNFEVRVESNPYHGERWKILTSVYAPREQAELWKELPQKIKDLAKEMGIPEDMLDYIPPRYPASGTNPDGTVTNPNT